MLNHIGDHIRKYRYDHKMKAMDCQAFLGVDKGTLIDWENGRHTPSRKMLARIVELLGYVPELISNQVSVL